MLKQDIPLGLLEKKDEHGIVRCNINDTESYIFHKTYTKGAHLRKLKDIKYHQIHWETPYYYKVLDAYLTGVNLQGGVFLDFGCGDGRFTQFLLERGAKKIVCVDFDYSTLVSLSEYVSENDLQDRVLIIHSDYDNMPFEGSQFDMVLSIGVLYYLNDQYENAIAYFNALLKSKGRLITSDPDIEGFLMRSLIFDSLDDALELYEKRRFKETKEKTDYTFRVFDEAEWRNIFKKTNFTVLDVQGISLFHNLLRILLLRNMVTQADIERSQQKIWNMFDYLHENGNIHKHKIWLLEKQSK